MHSGYLINAIVLVLAYLVVDVRSDEAEVKIVSSGYCSPALLKHRGVDPKNYQSKIFFDPKKISTIPAKPTVPGCFRVIAQNVTLKERVHQVTGEFEMRVASSADPSKPILQCKKRQPKCGCGDKDACMYCDFCKNFKTLVKEGKVNHKDLDIDHSAPTSCDCNIAPDTYTIDVEVCTPDEKELGENVPTEVLDMVTDGNDFSLFTTLYIYDFRFNNLDNGMNSQAAKDALKARKARGLIGCYVIGSNISV